MFHNANLKKSSQASSTLLPPLFGRYSSHLMFQLGAYWGIQGQAQHINIEGLIGDTFTVSNNESANNLAGLGYYIDGYENNSFKMSYGINAFYLPNATVSGYVIQEDLFTNLSYRYRITHIPLYAIAKANVPLMSPRYNLALDVGLGPNFMRTHSFQEYSLDGGITIPDNAFSGHRSTEFSATAGIGIKLQNALGNVPLECGYRFFYLGQGRLNKLTDQILNTLETGSSYANAIVCSVSV